jgi:two-component system, chemotaxis family, response regulator Rcp1
MAKESKPAKILMVEDNDPDVFLVQEALRAHGVPAQIQRCQDGEEALQVLSQLDESEIPDIVIIDLNLPKVPGIEILKHARSLKQLDRVPVLILTSSQSHTDRTISMQLGADAYISKPPTLPEFLSSVGSGIRTLLERSESGATTRLWGYLCDRPKTRHRFHPTLAMLQVRRDPARSSRPLRVITRLKRSM